MAPAPSDLARYCCDIAGSGHRDPARRRRASDGDPFCRRASAENLPLAGSAAALYAPHDHANACGTGRLADLHFTYATLAAKNRRAELVLIPILDVLQSVPILGYLSFTVVFFVSLFPGNTLGPELAAIFAIFTSQAWNMAFSFYQSLRTVPCDLDEASRSFRLSAWQRFWRLEVPFAMTYVAYSKRETATLPRIALVRRLLCARCSGHREQTQCDHQPPDGQQRNRRRQEVSTRVARRIAANPPERHGLGFTAAVPLDRGSGIGGRWRDCSLPPTTPHRIRLRA
jgi:hypothetical protein